MKKQNTKISSVVFDIGNVLLPFEYERAAKRLIEENRPSREPDRGLIVSVLKELELGHIGTDEFLERIRPEFNHTGDPSDFLEIWAEIFDPNPALYGVVDRLATQVPLYLLSNTNRIHREYFERTFPIFRLFEGGIFSYEVGLLKPDPAIFELTAERFGLHPATTLYIDDIAENVAAAESAGFLGVCYDHTRHEEGEERILAHFS